MKIEQLNEEVKSLKIKSKLEKDVDLKINFTRLYHEKALELVNLIHKRDESKKLGMSAREYLKYVDGMPTNPKYATGISKLDHFLGGGFESGVFVNIAGQSYAGKTTMALNIISNISNARKTAWFNFEMGDRLMAKKLKGLKLNANQLDNLYIECISNNIDNLLNEMELLVEDGYKFFGIDSSMKIEGAKGSQEYLRLGYISDKLSKFCSRKDVTIIFINQMSEESIDTKKLKFKGSGNTQYDSDISLFLVLDAKDGVSIEQRERFLICTKNRQNERTFNIPIKESDYKCNDVEITEFNAYIPYLD